MNKEDIVRMAREAGFEFNSLGATYTSGRLPDLLERFANLVAAAEREACAKICDSLNEDFDSLCVEACADLIRERGQE